LKIQHWFYNILKKAPHQKRAQMIAPKLPDSPIYDPQSMATFSIAEDECLAEFPENGIFLLFYT